MRTELKKPLGLLIKGNPDVTISRLKEIISDCAPPLFASVGDYVSNNILNRGLNPDLVVVDNRIMRTIIEPREFNRSVVKIKNRQGTINGEARGILKHSVNLKKKLALVVKGEEDLLVLPLLAAMPVGSIIVYGQPQEGLVVMIVNEKNRAWAKEFMERMEEEEN